MAEPGFKMFGVPYHERDMYQLNSWHFHFGRGDFEVSEYTMAGKRYAGESGPINNRPQIDVGLRRILPNIQVQDVSLIRERLNHCNGERQSPINIRTNSVLYGRPFSVKFILHNVMLKGRCVNNGQIFTFKAEPGYKMSGVPYHERDIYQLNSWHFHFGRGDFEGSEHTIDGQRYAGEIHMVYYNTKYGSYNDSLNYPDGRAAIAVFVQSGPISNRPRIDAGLRRVLPNIRVQGREFPEEIMAVDILPHSSDIYTYSGSATTSPCRQNIQWIIHRQPVILSETSLRLARQLVNSQGLPMGVSGNFRPTQRQNGRLVEANFIPFPWKPFSWFSVKY